MPGGRCRPVGIGPGGRHGSNRLRLVRVEFLGRRILRDRLDRANRFAPQLHVRVEGLLEFVDGWLLGSWHFDALSTLDTLSGLTPKRCCRQQTRRA